MRTIQIIVVLVSAVVSLSALSLLGLGTWSLLNGDVGRWLGRIASCAS